MGKINFKKEVKGNIDEVIKKLEVNLQTEGFGVLTRIDFSKKIEEKLKKKISPTVILGACNPKMAFEAFQLNSDVTSLLPCNVTVRDIGKGIVSVEVIKPSSLMEVLGNRELVELAKDADERLSRALEHTT